MLKKLLISLALYSLLVCSYANAANKEDYNDCRTTTGDVCERDGSCSIQGSNWYQYVTILKSGIYDTQGWAGLCDNVHVSLLQGSCSPQGAQNDVTAILPDTSFAQIPAISGALACGGDSGGSTGGGGGNTSSEICNDGIDNDADGLIDCADTKQCRKDAFCR